MKLTARSSSTVMSDPAEIDAPSDGKPIEARWAVTMLINDSRARFNRARSIVWDEKDEGYPFIGHESFIMTRSASGFEPIDGKFEARTDVVISYHLIEASKLHDW